MALLPTARRTNWIAGTNCGVTGGIPTTRSSVVTIVAPSDGSNAEPAITAGLNALTAEQVGYLPAGTYRLNTGISVPQHTTLRGAGVGVTILEAHNVNQGLVYMYVDTEGNLPNYDASWASASSITAGLTQGTTQITIASTSGFSTGDIVYIAEANDRTVPIIDTTLTIPRLREQQCKVIVDDATHLTIDPPLLWTLSATRTPQVRRMTSQYIGAGLEDLTIEMVNAGGVGKAIFMLQCVESWVKNVKIQNYNNYGIYMGSCYHCEVRHSYIYDRTSSGSNGAGVDWERSTGCLVEDNIFKHGFPHLEVNFFSCANAFGYNYCVDNDIGDFLSTSINTNHGSHNHFNLYEGNIAPKLQADGYFGSVSDDTVFRNWLQGSSAATTQFRVCIYLCRFTRNYNILNNVLGIPSLVWTYYKAPITGFTYNDKVIYGLGYPYIGGPGFTGTAQASVGSWWAIWRGQAITISGDGYYSGSTPYTYNSSQAAWVAVLGYAQNYNQFIALNAAKNGLTTWSTPVEGTTTTDWGLLGPNSWPEIDLDVDASTLILNNYNFQTNSIPAAEATAETVPNSYLHSSKPAWFGDRTWPVFSTAGTPNPSIEDIPAGYRYVHGIDPPDDTTVATPAFSPIAGAYANNQSVTITCATVGATIRYTTNGATPTSSSGTIYSSPVSISTATTLKAIAYNGVLTDSAVQSGAYSFQVALPEFSPVPGVYNPPTTITLSSATSGASLYYTTNGTTPTTGSTAYTVPIALTVDTTIKVLAVKSGYTNSTIASGLFTINAAAEGNLTVNGNLSVLSISIAG